MGLVAQPPHGLPRRREHLRSVASLACNVFPHAAVASPACNMSLFPTARKQSLLRSLLWEARSSLRALACSSTAWARTWPLLVYITLFIGITLLSCMIVLPFLLPRSLALSCLSCPSSSSSLSMPPLCSGQVGHPRIQRPDNLLRVCPGRSQVCDVSLCGLGLVGGRTRSPAATYKYHANCHTKRYQPDGCQRILHPVVALNGRFCSGRCAAVLGVRRDNVHAVSAVSDIR